MSSKKSKNTGKSSGKKTHKKTTTIPSNLKKDTRLISINDFDFGRIMFSEPQVNDVPDGSGKFYRIYLNYQYDDETYGPIIVEFGKKYCFGVQADNLDKDGKVIKDKMTGREKPLTGYRAPIVMTSEKDDKPATDEELREVQFIDDLRAEVIKHLIQVKAKIRKGTKSDSYFDDVSQVLYRKKDENDEYVEGVSPRLYAHLIWYSKTKEFGTDLYGPNDKLLHPLTLTSGFHIYPNLRFDSIFIGTSAMSLQHRLYDGTVEPIQRAPKPRLARKNTVKEEEAEVEDRSPSPRRGRSPGEKKSKKGKSRKAASPDPNDMMGSDEEEEEEVAEYESE